MNIVILCWSCGKEYSDVPLNGPYKCDCGGYVVSPSMKIHGRFRGGRRMNPPPTTSNADLGSADIVN